VIANGDSERGGFGHFFDSWFSDVGERVSGGQSEASTAFKIQEWMNIVNYLPYYCVVLLCTRDGIAVVCLFCCEVEETSWSIHAYVSKN